MKKEGRADEGAGAERIHRGAISTFRQNWQVWGERRGHGKDGSAKPSRSKCVTSGAIRSSLSTCCPPSVCSTVRFSSILPRKPLPEVPSSVQRPSHKSHHQQNSFLSCTCSPQLRRLLLSSSASALVPQLFSVATWVLLSVSPIGFVPFF